MNRNRLLPAVNILVTAFTILCLNGLQFICLFVIAMNANASA